MIWANYPGVAEIERAIDDAFAVTRAAEQIREANAQSAPIYSDETKKIIEMDEMEMSLSEQADALDRPPSWINRRRRALGLKDLKEDE